MKTIIKLLAIVALFISFAAFIASFVILVFFPLMAWRIPYLLFASLLLPAMYVYIACVVSILKGEA